MKPIPSLLLKLACNAAATAKRLAYAANDSALADTDDWQLISPYGIFAHTLGRQHFKKEQAEKIVTAFNELKAAKGRHFRGVDVFIGHPPGRGGPPSDKEFPRIGAVMQAEARPDGLWAKIAWNNKGKENVKEGHYLYPSPSWFFDEVERGVIAPNELDHVGMTNNPNICGVTPWTNEQTNETESMKNICKALGLDEASTEEQIVAKILALKSEKDTADNKVKEEQQAAVNERTARGSAETLAANAKEARDKADTALKAERAKHAKVLIGNALEKGKITQAEVAANEAAFAEDFDKAATALEALKPKISTNSVDLDLRDSRRSIATADERSAIIRTAVNEKMDGGKLSYDQAYAAVEADPKYKVVFEAMNNKSTAE